MDNHLPVFIKVRYDRGLCKTLYNMEGDNLNPKRLYCKYDGEDRIFVCSKDGEPSHPTGYKEYIIRIR